VGKDFSSPATLAVVRLIRDMIYLQVYNSSNHLILQSKSSKNVSSSYSQYACDSRLGLNKSLSKQN